MKNLEQQFSEDLSITQSSNSVREHSGHIPVDLLINIFSRVPIKSIGRFRCVSKSWGSIIRRPDFTELFLTKYSTRPRILFAIEVGNGGLSVFSSPQPQNYKDGEDYSVVATRYNSFPKYFPTRICPPLNGLVFLHGWKRRRVRVICNPLTGESITLPTVKATDIQSNNFGYDPISKQFKVLCMIRKSRYGRPNTHRILTLGTGKRVWRSTMECKPHFRSYANGICINGVLYYRARFKEGPPMMVCFDFSSEKFSFIKLHKGMLDEYDGTTLMNYKGKLCAPCFRDHWEPKVLVLWVLEDDGGEHKWSKSKCRLPPLPGSNGEDDRLNVVGMTGAGEIVFTQIPEHGSSHFYLFFYNMEKETFTRVNIQGSGEFVRSMPHIFLDYSESMIGL